MGNTIANGLRRTAGPAVAAALVSASAGPAHAEPADATGKGIAGGAMLGAEAVVITEALLGVESPWIYAGSALLGAAGGGVGGYFVENNADRRISFYMLMGGMALFIPTTIVYVDATNTQAHEEVVFDEKQQDIFEDDLDANPPEEGEDILQRGVRPMATNGSTSPSTASTLRQRATAEGAAGVGVPAGGLFAISSVGWSLSVPDVRVSPMFSATEVKELGVQQQTQLTVPLVRGIF